MTNQMEMQVRMAVGQQIAPHPLQKQFPAQCTNKQQSASIDQTRKQISFKEFGYQHYSSQINQ
jgi:hypothetical protein